MPDKETIVAYESGSHLPGMSFADMQDALKNRQQPCTGWLGRIFGHKFRARYSLNTTSPDDYEALNGMTDDTETPHRFSITFLNERKTYHHDICERCGAIRRQEAKP